MTRVPTLDGWRAVAITLVLLSHLPYGDRSPLSAEPSWLVGLGNLGVRIFFVLSGMLITLLLLREADRAGGVSLPRFYGRRAVRILPVCAAYLAVLGLLQLAGLYADAPSSWLGSLTFSRNLVGRGDSATVHFWSLAIEEQFYLAWPVAFSAFALWSRPRVFLGALLAIALFALLFRWQVVSAEVGGSLANRLISSKSPLAYADSLAIGCLAAPYALRGFSPRVPAWALCAGVVAGQAVPHAAAPTAQAMLVALLLLRTAYGPATPLTRALQWRSIEALGVLSYSLYVWHVLFLARFVPAGAGHIAYHWTVWWLPALAVSAASYYGLEQPLLRLRERLRAPSPVLLETDDPVSACGAAYPR